MSDTFFASIEPIRYAGPDSDDPLAFRWYDADRVVLGRTMREHLRFAACYWHSFNWNGFDIFGDGTLDRPWLAPGREPLAAAEEKMAAAFEFFEKLTVPFWCFHDHDIAPEGATFAESVQQPRPHGGPRRRAPGPDRRRAAVGHREAVRQPPLHGRRGHQPRPRGLRLRGRSGRALHGRDAPAGWAQLRALGRTGGLRHAAPHRHAARARPARAVPQPRRRAQAPDRLRGHDPHRAEAVRADQAPVRLRRGGRLRLPAALRPRARDQGQHRGQPRDALGARLRARGRCGGRAPGSSDRSTRTPATTAWAGTSTASRCRSSR